MNGYNWTDWKNTYQFDINSDSCSLNYPVIDTVFVFHQEGMDYINVVAYDWTDDGKDYGKCYLR